MNEVGKINPTTDAITYFQVNSSGGSPIGITAGPDGNLWFAASASEHRDDQPENRRHLRVHPSQRSRTLGDHGGPRRQPLVRRLAGKLGDINPTTDAITEYPVPYASSSPAAITTGPDGNLWFTDPGTNAIGVATLTTSQLVVTTQPPASVTAGSGFGLTVTAENNSGSPITTFNGTVTVALANNPGGATLGGTLTATASNGVATFSGPVAEQGRVRLHARGLRQRTRRGDHERHHRDPRGALASW